MMTTRIAIEGSYGTTDGSVHIHDEHGEVVMWDSAEWVEDPSLVYVIAEAIREATQEGTAAMRVRIGNRAQALPGADEPIVVEDDPRVTEAIERARLIVAEYMPADCEVSIETWNLPEAGLRVAEVSYGRAGVPGVDDFVYAGASYMQSDMPFGLALCAQVERVVITDAFMNDPQETEYEIDRLRGMLIEDTRSA